MNSAPDTPSPRHVAPARAGSDRLLCAYSPRWLSGPVPGYRGLCATWSPDESDLDADERDHASVF